MPSTASRNETVAHWTRNASRTSTRLLIAWLLPGAFSVAGASDKPRPAPPVNPAVQYTLHDEHTNEHVTIAAEPCMDQKTQCSFFRMPYLAHGFIPVRVVVTNDRDDALSLDDVRIQLIPAEGEKEPAATDEDLNRRLFTMRSTRGTRIPIIGITTHPEPIDKKILNDEADFGFTSTVVPAHATRAGYVFYDTRGLDDPPLKHAELYVKMIHYTDAKSVQHQLFAFSLPFDRWLDAQKKTDSGVKPSAQPDSNAPAGSKPEEARPESTSGAPQTPTPPSL